MATFGEHLVVAGCGKTVTDRSHLAPEGFHGAKWGASPTLRRFKMWLIFCV